MDDIQYFLGRMAQDMLDEQNKKTIEELEQENKALKEQLAIREKALEISIDKFIKYFYCMTNLDKEYGRLYELHYDDFIKQAKENIK